MYFTIRLQYNGWCILHEMSRHMVPPSPLLHNGFLLTTVISPGDMAPRAQLLQHCGRWPEPKSVLVMDSASFHRSEGLEQMCADAGVKLVYLPPYSLDLNPIEELFPELKGFIKRNWDYYEKDPERGFDTFLEWCVNVVGAKEESARGHFRHAGLNIEVFDA